MEFKRINAPIVNLAVKEGLERIKRLCQINFKSIDSIDNLLFGNYKPGAKISVLGF